MQEGWDSHGSYDHYHFHHQVGYLEDHPRYRKWLGSPQFVSQQKRHLEGVPQALGGLTNHGC